MSASSETGGIYAASLLASRSYGRPAQLLVLALRDTALLIGKQLASEGMSANWRLHIAHSVARAWQRMNETNFDLILVDLNIPKLRACVGEIVAAAGATLVYGLCDDERGDIAEAARGEGIADVLATHHVQGSSALRIIRLMLEGARIANSSRLLTAAVEGAPVAYAMADALQPDMPLVYINEHFVTLTGYQSNEVIGRNCRFLQGPDTDSRDVDRIREAIRHAQPLYIELINYRKDRQPFWNGLLLRPIRAAKGTVTHFVATLRDMTERRRTEESLERSARLHRLLIQATGGMTIFANADGQLRAPLPEFEAFTGLRYSEYRSGDWHTVVHLDDRQRYIDARNATLHRPRDHTFAFRLWHAPSTTWRHVELRMLPLYDSTDTLTEWIGTLTDINDRLPAEQMQNKSHEFFATALETLPMLMMFFDRDAKVRWINRRCAAWLQESNEELHGESLLDMSDDVGRAQLAPRIQAVLAGETQRFIECVTLRHRKATLSVALYPHRPQNTKQGIKQDMAVEGFYWVASNPAEQQPFDELTQPSLTIIESN